METKFGTGIVKGEDSFEVGKQAAQKALSKIDRKADLSIVFSSSKYDYNEVIKGVREAANNAPLIGCSTAGEFTEEEVLENSVAVGIVSTDSCKFFLGVAKGLKENPFGCVREIDGQIEISEEDIKNFPNRILVVLGDGVSGRGEELTTSASMTFNMRLVGGTAGDDMKMKETHVFINDRTESDAVGACEILSKSPIIFSVKHGHTPISPPLEVTKFYDNVIYEIDNKPAWEVWKEYCKKYAEGDLGIDVDEIKEQVDIASILTAYEAGIQAGAEWLIRWPGFSTDVMKDGSLSFTTTFSEGTMIRVMRGTEESLINSARKAAEEAISKIGKNIAGALIFDCVIRSTVLKRKFAKAVEEIKNVLGVPLLGFETYGEIGMEIGDISGFHNTTTVVVLIPK